VSRVVSEPDSDPNYTLDCEEPLTVKSHLHRSSNTPTGEECPTNGVNGDSIPSGLRRLAGGRRVAHDASLSLLEK
jgi:hypothetical protein